MNTARRQRNVVTVLSTATRYVRESEAALAATA